MIEFQSLFEEKTAHELSANLFLLHNGCFSLKEYFESIKRSNALFFVRETLKK